MNDEEVLQATAVLPEHVLLRRVSEELILLNLDSESYYGLDATGTEILEAVLAGVTVAAALDRLRHTWDVDGDRLRLDTLRLLEQLADAGLVGFTRS